MPTALFWVEETDEVELSLRRFTFGSEGFCRKVGTIDVGHSCSRRLKGRWKASRTDEGFLDLREPSEFRTRRWPGPCESCGESFRSARRQVNQERVYRAADGREWRMDDLPPGACFDAHWLPEAWKSPGGIGLSIVVPLGIPAEKWIADHHIWHPYAPATGGGNWDVTWPNPPDVSALQASPSIAHGGAGTPGYYHGWLGINGAPPGYLSDHIG